MGVVAFTCVVDVAWVVSDVVDGAAVCADNEIGSVITIDVASITR